MNKARAWLDKRAVAYAFHDHKTTGIDRKRRRNSQAPFVVAT
jgi:arsenate reductase-like glutaredoxin family protein